MASAALPWRLRRLVDRPGVTVSALRDDGTLELHVDVTTTERTVRDNESRTAIDVDANEDTGTLSGLSASGVEATLGIASPESEFERHCSFTGRPRRFEPHDCHVESQS